MNETVAEVISRFEGVLLDLAGAVKTRRYSFCVIERSLAYAYVNY